MSQLDVGHPDGVSKFWKIEVLVYSVKELHLEKTVSISIISICIYICIYVYVYLWGGEEKGTIFGLTMSKWDYVIVCLWTTMDNRIGNPDDIVFWYLSHRISVVFK